MVERLSPEYLTSRGLRDHDMPEVASQPPELALWVKRGTARSGQARGRRSAIGYRLKQGATRAVMLEVADQTLEISTSRRPQDKVATRSSNIRDCGSVTRDQCEQETARSSNKRDSECYEAD
ncbi:hypothetical protein ACOSQ3_013647 [Xanthoceras sorbifolium]